MLQMTVLKETKKKVPKVLIQAKERANKEVKNLEKGVTSYDKGPWDEGHWANRK